MIAVTAEAPNKLLLEKKREAFEQVTEQAQSLLIKQREDYERQREAIALQHHEHMETMRKQNELLQEEVKKTRELYAQTYLQFEVTPPSANAEESRALLVQATLAKSLKNQATRHKADYEMEKSKRMPKEKELEEAEQRIAKLREELDFLEESFEVVVKRPLAKNEGDSPEMRAEKKVKIE